MTQVARSSHRLRNRKSPLTCAVFEKRRPATANEIAQLVASLDVIDTPAAILEAEMSEVATLAELGALHTVLAISDARPGANSFYTVAELQASWSLGRGSPDDQRRYGFHLERAIADPNFSPELLFAPTRSVSSGWWMIDGIHRAVALLTARHAVGTTALRLPVFVLPRSLP